MMVQLGQCAARLEEDNSGNESIEVIADNFSEISLGSLLTDTVSLCLQS